MLFALCMAFFWLHIPPIQSVLGTSNVPVENFFLPALFGLGMLFLDECRKYAVRRWPNGFLAMLAW
jgi:sodium/potassium-transporting ATPase subunit alpha